MALAEKALAYVSHLIDLQAGQQHDPAYVAINPNHVVPTLVHDGQIIRESMLIGEYVEEAFPDAPLTPSAPKDRYRVRLWTLDIDRVHAHAAVLTYAMGPRRMMIAQGEAAIERYIAGGLTEAGQALRRQIIDEGVASEAFGAALGAFVALLDRIEAALGDQPWLAGEAFSLADVSALPYVMRLDHLAMTPLIEARPKVLAWYDRVRARPSFKVAVADHLQPTMVAALRTMSQVAWPEVEALLNR